MSLIQVARYAGVPAWQMAQAPSFWLARYAVVMEAEAHAQEWLAKHPD